MVVVAGAVTLVVAGLAGLTAAALFVRSIRPDSVPADPEDVTQ